MEQAHALPKHLVLQEFTAALYRYDIAGLASSSSSEYEAEALSILSRFCEASLQVAENEDAVVEFAVSTIQQTFKYWFNVDVDGAKLQPLALELLKIYIESFPQAPDEPSTPEQP